MKTMTKSSLLMTCLLSTATLLPAIAGVSPEEAEKLGKTLTPFGAEISGNAEGTIPAYTGGLRTAPAEFDAKSGVWANPYKNEKPVFRIDASNVNDYADKLSAGQKKLFEKYPETFYMDVYPTHRTAAFPQKFLDASMRNATGCSTTQDGLGVDTACRGGLPFPIPKTGQEIMWNQQLRYQETTTTSASRSWVVNANGDRIMASQQKTYVEVPYYFDDLDGRDERNYWNVWSVTQSPIRKAGEVTGIVDYIDPVDKPRYAWSYTPGLRRIKKAPEFSYDTPVSSMGGVTLFDELFVFSGMMDRFDYKLVGKKEMYLPYNAYELYFECDIDAQFLPEHADPKCWRWELHRVWVVEATLKEGTRHVYDKRTYYFDEDNYGTGLYDAFDKSGELYRSIFNAGIQFYDVDAPYSVKNVVYDFNKGMYALLNDGLEGGYQVVTPLSNRNMNPEVIVSKQSAR